MDIIAAIDQATGCQQCGGPLAASPSDDFCDQDCQQAWAAARVTPLVGYREPWGFGPEDYEPAARRPAVAGAVHPAGDIVVAGWLSFVDSQRATLRRMVEVSSGQLYRQDFVAGVPVEPGSRPLSQQPVGTVDGDVVFTTTTPDPGSPLEDLWADREQGRVSAFREAFQVDWPEPQWTQLDEQVEVAPFRQASTDPGRSTLLDDLRRWADVYTATGQAASLVEAYRRNLAALAEVAAFGEGMVLCAPDPDNPDRVMLGFDGSRPPQVSPALLGEIRRAYMPDRDPSYFLRALDEQTEQHARLVEARDRALELRRNRNTGPPPPRRRAPRQLPPRRSR